MKLGTDELLRSIIDLLHFKGVLTDEEYSTVVSTMQPGMYFIGTAKAIEKITRGDDVE